MTLTEEDLQAIRLIVQQELNQRMGNVCVAATVGDQPFASIAFASTPPRKLQPTIVGTNPYDTNSLQYKK